MKEKLLDFDLEEVEDLGSKVRAGILKLHSTCTELRYGEEYSF